MNTRALFLGAALSVASIAPAAAQVTPLQAQSDINNNIATGKPGGYSAADLRNTFYDFLGTTYLSVNPQTGVLYYFNGSAFVPYVPTLNPSSVTAAMLVPGAAASNLGPPGGDLGGSWPNPTVLGINGQLPAKVATSGSAGDLGGQPLNSALLPAPTTTTPGGVKSILAVPHYYLNGINGQQPTAAQPMFADLPDQIQLPQVPPNLLTYAQMAQSPAQTFSGNSGASPANRTDIPASTATSMLSPFVGDSGSGGTKGLVPAPPAGSAALGLFLGAGGAFSAPSPFTGDTGSGGKSGAVPAPPAGSAAASQFLGAAGGFAVPPVFTGDSGSGGKTGYVPAPPAGSAANNQFLGAGGGFASPPNFTGDTGSGGKAGYVPAPPAGSAANGLFLSAGGGFAAPPAASPRSSVRQTVQGGPQSAGAPSFLPSTSASLSLTAQNISTGPNALTVAAAQGSNATGQNDIITQITSNPTWSGLIGSQTVSSISATASAATVTTAAAHNLVAGATVTISGASQTAINGTFVVASIGSSTTFTINGPNPQTGAAFAAGSVTGASYTVQNYLAINASSGATVTSLLVPIYQYGGTIPTTAGQFAFDINAMIGYVAGTATPLVYVGEATASASTITASAAYAYNGYYDSGFTNTLPAANVINTIVHNLGATPLRNTLYVEAIAFDAATGYLIGDGTTQILMVNSGVAYIFPPPITVRRLSANFAVVGAYYLTIKTGASAGKETAISSTSNFKWKVTFARGWGGA